jgi:hypothetical protein
MWFAPNGSFIRQVSARPKDGINGYMPERVISALSNGSVLVVGRNPAEPVARKGVYRPMAGVSLYDPVKKSSRFIARIAELENFMAAVGGGGRAWARNTFVTASGDRFYIGDSDSQDVLVYSSKGDLVQLIRLRFPWIRVTAADRDAYIGSYKSDRNTVRRKVAEAMDFPETFPMYADLQPQPDGTLWIRRFAGPLDSITRFTVIGKGGRGLANLDIPSRGYLLEAGPNYVILGEKDEDGNGVIRVYPLIKS